MKANCPAWRLLSGLCRAITIRQQERRRPCRRRRPFEMSVTKLHKTSCQYRNMNDQEAVSALGALANADRLAAYRLLMAAGGKGLPSGIVAGKLDIPPTRMSFHLATLERAGLLSRNRAGRQVCYCVDPAMMKSLLGFLVADCCGNDPAICGIRLNQA